MTTSKAEGIHHSFKLKQAYKQLVVCSTPLKIKAFLPGWPPIFPVLLADGLLRAELKRTFHWSTSYLMFPIEHTLSTT